MFGQNSCIKDNNDIKNNLKNCRNDGDCCGISARLKITRLKADLKTTSIDPISSINLSTCQGI